jgi:hypothetical protein
MILSITCIVGSAVARVAERFDGGTPLRGVVLQSFIGGLGNQLFQVAAVVELARRNGAQPLLPRQAISLGFVNSPIYTDNLFKAFETVEVRNEWPVHGHGSQFGYEDIQGRFVDQNVGAEYLVVAGALMNMRYCAGSVDALRDLLFPGYRKQAGTREKVMLGLRGWTEENKPEWRIPVEYFRNALAALPPGGSGDRQYLVLTDDAEYAESVVAELRLTGGGEGVEVVVGNRSWESIAEQYSKAMQCDHFILNYSTFHLWPALFAGGGTQKVIVYPKVDSMTGIELEVYRDARFVSIDVPGTFRPFS